MYRKGSFNELLSGNLQKSKKFRKTYILTIINDESIEPVEALKEVIEKMGVKDFSNLADIPIATVSRFLNGNDTPKAATLDRFLAPFGLKTRVDFEQVA